MITLFDDLVIEPHRLFHVSPKSFDFPCRQKINEARSWSQWHQNGVLGLWCSTFPRMCSAFGKHVYEVEMAKDARAIGVPLGQFQDLTSHMEDFTDLIDFLIGKGDVAYVVDSNPFVGEVIVLDFDRIANFTEVTNDAPIDVRAPMHSSLHDEYNEASRRAYQLRVRNHRSTV